MTIKKLTICTCALTAIAVSGAAHAISVTQDDDGTTLANTILGSGITITSTNVIGNSAAFGTFTDGNASGLDIDEGIILSTGQVVDAVGPNNSGSTQTNFGESGYAPLDAATGTTTQDAAAFEITFTSDGGDIFFDYIFASEEYNEFVDAGFNDAFALLLDGTNIALLNDGLTPVTIDNVNAGDTPTLFNNNESGAFDIEYDGFTTAFRASFFGLDAGQHTLAFAIGDVGDGIYDSAVFIAAGSLTDTNPDVPEPGTLALIGLGALGLGLRRKK